MKRFFWTVFVCVALLIGGVLGRYLLFGPAKSAEHLPPDKLIAGACRSISSKLPLQINQKTRIDQIVPGEGKQVIYLITLDVPNKAQGNASNAMAKLKPSLVAACKRDPAFDEFRKHRIEVVYKFRNTNQETFATLVLMPHELF